MKTLDYQLLPKDHRTQLGLVVLQSDVTLEDEFRIYFNDQRFSLLANRIPFENEVTTETLKQMEQHIAATVSLFPMDAEFQSMGYACTSGALHIGSERIETLVQQHCDCQHVTNPMQAVIRALNYLKASKIAFLAPYSKHVSQTMIDELERCGIGVVCAATFDESQDVKVGRISPESIRREAVDLCEGQGVDAVFIACTNMKCADIIPQIEADTGVVALSSNLALAWDMARLAGQPLHLSDRGKLCQ